MKKILLALVSAVAILSSCSIKDEWTPVFTGKYPDPEEFQPTRLKATHTIRELCAMYTTGSPKIMTGNMIIAGKVISTDQPGNFYKSFYIQDETAGIEIKVGRNSLYSDFHEGQTVYIYCNDLWLGMYGYKDGSYGGQGMVQIGAQDVSGDYETSYIEAPLMIDTHIFCGEMGDPVHPVVVAESQLPKASECQKQNQFVGKLVTLKGLSYDDGTFILLYPDSSRPHTSNDPENRVFLSNENSGTKIPNSTNWKVTTWAASKANIAAHLKAGDWDKAEVGSGSTQFGPITGVVRENGMFADEYRKSMGKITYKDLLIRNVAAQSVSQYFVMGNTSIALRTSGFCKFADVEIPADVLGFRYENGAKVSVPQKKVNITGVLTMYQGSIQLVVNRLTDITYEDGTPLYK